MIFKSLLTLSSSTKLPYIIYYHCGIIIADIVLLNENSDVDTTERRIFETRSSQPTSPDIIISEPNNV
ncbi:24137_t:CDS:2 [Dentiscutata erythropus]|uniref:24137_t:CDS:1 n=1 Tax=Dentiscutata erythropus TaxID=1348616 RepID=A0A9N8ZGD3_9GLOM|nr:24137_t:CDS:2 [Dentiscutata erythropus]